MPSLFLASGSHVEGRALPAFRQDAQSLPVEAASGAEHAFANCLAACGAKELPGAR